MRVMLATDGSRSSMVAADLVASSPWGRSALVDVVSVVDDAAVMPSPFATLPADAQSLDEALEEHLRGTVEEAADMMRAFGMSVTTTMLHGRPTDRLLYHACSTN